MLLSGFMSQAKHVNYDAIAPGYDRRVEQGTYLVGVTQALQKLARQVKASRIVDLGCGTGRSLRGVADSLQPAPIVYGLDLSAGMLAQARSLDAAYRLVQASAPAPPFVSASFDLVFCAHAFHHFPNKPQVVRAAYALLRPGGVFAIVNFDPREVQRSDWPIYEYFEGTYETDLGRFPALADQETMLREAGFQQISSPVVQYIESNVMGEAIFENYHIRKEACSQLILISTEAYQAGLERISAKLEAAKARGETVVFRTYLKNRMCHGLKPSL
jgi:ubiquinone/menaquinone biosynthesis C-methylase UbiE